MEEKNKENHGSKLPTYEDIYYRLQKCYNLLFVKQGDQKPVMTQLQLKSAMEGVCGGDQYNNYQKNSLVEVPQDDELANVLHKTYLGNDTEYINGFIGLGEPEDQYDGIINMALLVYLSNRLSKEESLKGKDIDLNFGSKNKQGSFYLCKHVTLQELIACCFVLSKTSIEHDQRLSYGLGHDENDKSAFFIDLLEIGQISVHFGREKNKEMILKQATLLAKSILNEKQKRQEISKEKFDELIEELENNKIIPEYQGRFYERVGAFPICYKGAKLKKYEKLLKSKLVDDLTIQDLEILKNNGLNDRELYYLLIKIGAPKQVLYLAIPQKEKSSCKETQDLINYANANATYDNVKNAQEQLKELLKEKDQDQNQDQNQEME